MAKVPYASYLRIYEPLAAFPEPERAYWERYARRSRLPDEQDELRQALVDLASSPERLVPERESEEGFVATVGGVLCVCPWRTRLRAWQALEDVGHWMMPESVLEQAAPTEARDRAARGHSRWMRENPDARPWIRSALWHVPIRWFVLFGGEERYRVEPAGPGRPGEGGSGGGAQGADPCAGAKSGSGPGSGSGSTSGAFGGDLGGAGSLRYRTSLARARERLERGLRTVRAAAPDGPLTPALLDVGRWLEDFHPRSLVELDYGGLVHTIPAEQLAEDHSAAEVGAALTALAEEDLSRAGELYEAVAERWMAVRERQFAS